MINFDSSEMQVQKLAKKKKKTDYKIDAISCIEVVRNWQTSFDLYTIKIQKREIKRQNCVLTPEIDACHRL